MVTNTDRKQEREAREKGKGCIGEEGGTKYD